MILWYALKVGSHCGQNQDYMISQINDYNHTHNTYISSKNLLMLTPRNRCNNRYTKFT